jgi:hypothetical protein
MIYEKVQNIIGLSHCRQVLRSAEMGIPTGLSTPGDGFYDVNLPQLAYPVMPDSHAVFSCFMNISSFLE